jgi:hypothetical protein
MITLAALIMSAWSATPVEQARIDEVERVRAEVGDQIQLWAYDLIDELVYGWTQEPAFDRPTPVVLAGVGVPVGLGTGLQALVENHLNAVLAQNPNANLQLVHCPTCTAVVVRSGPEGTVVSRGIDDPAVLAELGAATGQHALFVDIEAEGALLVLRARLTRLTPDLPIVWSHTLTTSASSPALLRQADRLKSAEQAREEYLGALRDRGPITVPVRFGVRSYARSDDPQAGQPPPPFLWLQTGVEIGTTEARAWTASLIAGYAFIPEAYQGIMAQARLNRLVTGRARSQTRPDLYAFTGAAVMHVWGPATATFPEPSFGGLQAGLDLRLGNRLGMAAFLETLPSLRNSANLGDHVRVLGVGFQSLGTEVTVCF